jgi:hypothetical protein
MIGKSKEEAKEFYIKSLRDYLLDIAYVHILLIYYDMRGGNRGGPFADGERDEKENAIIRYFEDVWESKENFDYETELSYQCLYKPCYIDCMFSAIAPLEMMQNYEIRLKREGEEREMELVREEEELEPESEPTTPDSLPALIEIYEEPIVAYPVQSFALYEEPIVAYPVQSFALYEERDEEDDGYTIQPTYFGIYETVDENYDTYTGEPIMEKKISVSYHERSEMRFSREGIDKKCGICWEKDVEIITGCGHGFCTCIMKNIVDYNNDSCPLCKQELMALCIYNEKIYETMKRDYNVKVWSFV